MKKIGRTAMGIVVLLLTQCIEEKDLTYQIGKNHVGKLERTTAVADLESVFALDSVVQDTLKVSLGNGTTKINVYEKGGAHLLTLTPNSDSIPTIENIRVHDARYLTANGIGVQSTFKDIKAQYSIKKIVTSMSNVVIFVKDSDIYFTISKEELPASLRYVTGVNIEEVQIPDTARIKYLMVGWD